MYYPSAINFTTYFFNCLNFHQIQYQEIPMKQSYEALLDFSKIDNVCYHDMKNIRHSDLKNQTFYQRSIKFNIKCI